MAIEGTNNAGNENPNQEQGGRKILKAVRRLGQDVANFGQGAANKVVDTGAAVVNHPTTKDAVITGVGGTTIAGGLLIAATTPFTLPTAMVVLGMGLGLGASAQVAGTVVKNAVKLGSQGVQSIWNGVSNMFTRAPQAEANAEAENLENPNQNEDVQAEANAEAENLENPNQNEDVQAEENTRNDALLDRQRTVTFAEGRGGKRSAPTREDSRAKRGRATASHQAPDSEESDAEEPRTAVVRPTQPRTAVVRPTRNKRQ